MKVLLDTVFTQRPSVCSTSYLMWEIVERLSAWRPDVFFYFLYPPHKMEKQDWDFMDRFKDRVTLLPLEQSTSDRVSELHMLRNDLRLYLNPWSEYTWDTDVVLSSRMPVLKHMRVHASRFMGQQMPSQRAYIGIEEMPILPFRDTVPWSEWQYADTLMSYALSDSTLVCHQWMKGLLKPVAKEVLSPAWAKKVLDNVHEVVPVKLQRLRLKTDLYSSGPFKLTFVGRITGTRNFGDVAELFRKQFSYPLGKNKQDMQFLVSTNSEAAGAGKYGETDFIDLRMNNREQFYEFLKTAHVAVNLSTVEDFSLSTYETLLAGVPTIVDDHPWNAFLGPDYPFRCNSKLESYALVNAFAGDYAAQYQRFRDWESTWWKSYVEGPLNVTTSEKLITILEAFECRRSTFLKGKGGSFVERLREVEVVDGQMDLTKYFKEKDTCRMEHTVAAHFSLPLGRVPSTLMLKLLAEQAGWKDTNKTGVMKR